uniref:Uncharacterized protein n=1 Tax=Oryza barthii TaxID=65489 RepID=A0A0D3H3V3_9ORYZ
MSRRDSSIGSSAAAAASSTTGGGFSSPFPNLGVPLSSPQSTDPRRHNPLSSPLSVALAPPQQLPHLCWDSDTRRPPLTLVRAAPEYMEKLKQESLHNMADKFKISSKGLEK